MKPMLAATVKDASQIQYPIFASPKLDGVRGIVNGELRSRSLKRFPNEHVEALFSRKVLAGFDGELILGSPTAKDVYRVTNGACARHEGEPNVKFWAFDLWNHAGPFKTRLKELEKRASKVLDDVILLPQTLIENEEQMKEYEELKLSDGYEGVILRSPDGLYKFGRSTIREQGMLKLKRFEDGEAEILAIEEEMENTNEAKTNALGRTERSSHMEGLVPKGRAGTLCVKDCVSGVEFRIGTGLDDDDRVYYWKHRLAVVGKIVKYKHFTVGAKDKPRHPVYLGPREEWDL